MVRHVWIVGLAVAWGWGCGALPSSVELPYEVSTLDGRGLDEASPVGRFRLTGSLTVPISDLWLVPGEVSSTSARRLARNDPPQTLEEDRLPLAVWPEEGGWILAPLVPLEPGDDYSFVALGWGLVTTFTVSEEPEPLLVRQGSGAVRSGDWLVYCAAAAVEGGFFEQRMILGPERQEIVLHRGLGEGELLGERCVSFRAPQIGNLGYFVAPERAGHAGFFPEAVPLWPAQGEELEAPEMRGPCGLGALEPCVRVRRAAIELDVDEGFTVARAQGDGAPPLEALLAVARDATLILGPLQPFQEYRLDVVHVSAGRLEAATALVQSGAAAGRLVLNEVLANPLGPEPAAEWIEIYNVGTAAEALRGYELADAGASVPLPDVRLEAGEFGVIVGAAYAANPDLDVVPAPSALPLLVPALGQGGLLNSGEILSLFDRGGELVSRVPALAAPAGISVARRDPWSPDQPASFADHAGPGASPGAPNRFDEPGR